TTLRTFMIIFGSTLYSAETSHVEIGVRSNLVRNPVVWPGRRFTANPSSRFQANRAAAGRKARRNHGVFYRSEGVCHRPHAAVDLEIDGSSGCNAFEERSCCIGK